MDNITNRVEMVELITDIEYKYKQGKQLTALERRAYNVLKDILNNNEV